MTRRNEVTRREMLKGTGGAFAAAALSLGQGGAPVAPARPVEAGADITGQLARYMVESRDRALPPAVAREAKHRILDTLGAIVSGSTLKPGEMAVRYTRT